jgi:hypothetical protein
MLRKARDAERFFALAYDSVRLWRRPDIWFNSNGDPVANRTIKETGGETVVTTTSVAGEVLHTLHIDAVGIP